MERATAVKRGRPWWHWLLAGCGSLIALGALAVFALLYAVYAAIKPADEAVCPAVVASGGDLKKARLGFKPEIGLAADPEPAPIPPPSFELVTYPSGSNKLYAYLSRPTSAGKHPALIWLIGGFDNGASGTPWKPAEPANDQSAAVFREAGLVMMYPSLRGGDGNPGHREILYGEVDDVIAAAEAFRDLPYVDSSRLYLGGHSTGGTLALLVAAAAPKGLFRAVISFGPAADIGLYGEPWDSAPPCERELRSPLWFMSSITSPTFIIEGARTLGNATGLPFLKERAGDAPVEVFKVRSADHFTVLQPVSRVLADKLMVDTGPSTNLKVSLEELEAAVE